jgi:hypothetical protein
MNHPIKLSSCLESVDSQEGRQRVADFLESQPFPHYRPVMDRPGLLARIDGEGCVTVGRFVKRQFQPVKPETERR